MASATGVRVLFFGSHKQPSYVIETCPIPQFNDLSEGETLIKILMSTICPLDLDHIDGKREVTVPCVLGHEGVGEVIFSSHRAVHPGERVIFTNLNQCGCCCTHKAETQEFTFDFNRCQGAAVKKKRVMSGCFSTHMVLNKDVHIVSVPPNVSNESACLANCALATMVHAVSFLKLSGISQNSKAIVQGANLKGLFGCALLRNAGFNRVYCHDIESERLKAVSKFGGIPVLIKDYDCNGNEIHKDCEDVDVVIDVCGRWDVVPQGIHVLRHNGIYIFVGTLHDEHMSLIDIDTVIKKSITIKGIHSYAASHLEEAIKFLSETASLYRFDALVNPCLSLHDFHNAVSMARSNKFCRTAIRTHVLQGT